jgi:hypothetical protein
VNDNNILKIGVQPKESKRKCTASSTTSHFSCLFSFLIEAFLLSSPKDPNDEMLEETVGGRRP